MQNDNQDKAKKVKTCAADTVISILEERIYKGELKEGTKIPAERELSEEFGISRTVAREAVKALGERGLIKVLPRHRPVVKQLNYDMAFGRLGGLVSYLVDQPQGIKDLFNVRIFIEVGLVRQTALLGTKDDITRLREALEKNKNCIEKIDKFYQSDIEFHAVLYQIPRNSIFPAIHQAFCDWFKNFWNAMPFSIERNQWNFEDHKAIFEAILSRDPDLAEEKLKAHLNTSWEHVKKHNETINQ